MDHLRVYINVFYDELGEEYAPPPQIGDTLPNCPIDKN
jgi:hypothetical protein